MRYCFSQQDTIVWEHSGRQWNGSFASFTGRVVSKSVKGKGDAIFDFFPKRGDG